MFQELWPLLQRREIINLQLIKNDDMINIIVIPTEGTSIKDPTEAQRTALTMPFAVKGTPEDLDEGLAAKLLRDGVKAHLTIEDQAKKISEQTAAGVAAMEQEQKEKLKNKSSSVSKSGPATKPKSPPEPPPEPPKKPLPPSLFDAPADDSKDSTAPAPVNDIAQVESVAPSAAPSSTPMTPVSAPAASLPGFSDDSDEEEELLRTPIDEDMLVAA